VDLRHEHGREVFVYLLDVGLIGRVTLLFPDPDGHEVLDPGATLTIGARRGDAMELFVPDDLAPGHSGGVGHLVVVAAERRLSTAKLLSGSVAGGAISAVSRSYDLSRS
jgi:hypothetical protein